MNIGINRVDVGPLDEAELDRRQPDRATFRPTTAGGGPAIVVNEERHRRLFAERHRIVLESRISSWS